MKSKKNTPDEPAKALRELALRHPHVEEGVACEGTVIEKRTMKVRGKAFLFLGPRDALLKLNESLPEAVTLAKAEPERYRAGAGGWVKVSFGPEAPVDLALLARWIDESFRVVSDPHAPSRRAPRKAKISRREPKPRKR